MTALRYDALLLVSFGGPEGHDDVLPFLENVLRGRNVPARRKAEVAQHYYRFGGVSPINQQSRLLIEALRHELSRAGLALPVYWGNRNWHPLLADTLRQMMDDGVRNALAFFTSAYSSYSGCRQYLEDLAAARREIGADAPQVWKLRSYFNHPRFVNAWAERVGEALGKLDAPRSHGTRVLFSAHSLPTIMADACSYVAQLTDLACEIATQLDLTEQQWQLVYQSRSGPPQQPWLEPDVCDTIGQLAARGDTRQIVVAPIGFLSDHIEVLFDLDVQAAQTAEQAGIKMVRAATLGTHPALVTMVRELIEERNGQSKERPVLGTLGPAPDICPPDCCQFVPTKRSTGSEP